MAIDGLQRMLDFLNYLDDKNVHFFIEQNAPDSLRVTLTLVGIRIEAYFFVNEMWFSLFKGDEGVEVGEEVLRRLIDERASE